MNAKQPWVDAVEFALAECVRYNEMIKNAVREKSLSSLKGRDLLYELRAADGRKFTYGPVAREQLAKAAEDALGRSRFSSSLSFERYFTVVQSRIVERFIDQGATITLGSVDSVLTGALNEAAAQRGNSRHLIPCQLMFQSEPEKFSIGPVTFHNQKAFGSIAGELLQAIRVKETNDVKPTLSEQVLGYYDKFTWVADVTIQHCDQKIGEERAVQAVNAAVDFMQILFGHYHSRKMVAGGPGLASDLRATLEVREGETQLSYSIGSTSAMGFPKGWSSMLNDPEAQKTIATAGRAIEAITDPNCNRPLGLRYIEAASWHGQAVREASAAASIVKAVTALERLVTVKKGTDTTRIVTERNAAMSYDPREDKGFDELIAHMEGIYDLRSRLAHGTLSPFDLEVRRRRSEVLGAAERSLINGLGFLDMDGAFDKAISNRNLTATFETLVAWARRIDTVKSSATQGS